MHQHTQEKFDQMLKMKGNELSIWIFNILFLQFFLQVNFISQNENLNAVSQTSHTAKNNNLARKYLIYLFVGPKVVKLKYTKSKEY